jgi:hypothetical protein
MTGAPTRSRRWRRKAPSARPLSKDLSANSRLPRAVWIMVPAGCPPRKPCRNWQAPARREARSSTAAIRYFKDDVRRSKACSRKKDQLSRRRHQRRRLGRGARLLPDDRRRRPKRSSVSTRSSPPWRPGSATIPARRDGQPIKARPRRATCIAARPVPAISSRWSTTASNTA